MFIDFWDKHGNYCYNVSTIASLFKQNDENYFDIEFKDGRRLTYQYDSSNEAYSLYCHIKKQLKGEA